MPKKLRAAVIGGGSMGKNHLRTYGLLRGVELVALADINPLAKDLSDAHGARFYTDFKEMLDAEKPDMVSVVVPTPLHHRVGLEVMQRGIHCLLEKPIASSVEQAEDLLKCARDNQVVFTVGHIEHYNPLVIALKQVLDKGTIGEVTSIVCKRVGGFPTVEPQTDVIIDLAVHDIGIISHLLGKKPKQVSSHGSRTHHSQKIDSAEILLDYGHASGFIQANWLTPVKIRTIAVTGSKGYVEGNYITQELEYYEHNMQKNKPEGSFHEFIFTMGEPKKSVIKVNFQEPLLKELEAFLSHVRGEKDHYIVDAREATEALRVALETITPFEVKGGKA